MTEEQWLGCADDVEWLANYVIFQTRATDRKARLFACACCHRIERQLGDELLRLLESTEQFADGKLLRSALEQMTQAGWRKFHPRANQRDVPKASLAAESAVLHAAEFAYSDRCEDYETEDDHHYAIWASIHSVHVVNIEARVWPANAEATKAERRSQVQLLRDIFGNPFRPVLVAPAWQSTDVVSLAQAIYDERAFDRMPILGDAMEDAGCTNEEILAHCRGPGPHSRGCWVVDLILGKEGSP